MNKIVELKMNDRALMSLGLYSAKSNGVDRTPWQEGWNAMFIKIRENKVVLNNWIKTLDEEDISIVEMLIDANILFFAIRHDDEYKIKASPWLIMNDVFYPAADGEEINVCDLKQLGYLYCYYGYEGLVAWVSIKRGNIKPRTILKGYNEAKEYLTKE